MTFTEYAVAAKRTEVQHGSADPCAAFNCQCGGPIHSVMGVERCEACGKLAGDSLMMSLACLWDEYKRR